MDYVVSVSDLYERIKEIKDDGMDFVAVSLLEADNSTPDLPIPPSIHFDAFRKDTPFEWVDYEEIDVAESFT